jgi:SAM-dependent methyltransferase
MSVSNVRETLESIGAIASANIVQFASRTRDREIPVFRDTLSGVIFIDNYYVGDDEYLTGQYRGDSLAPNFEDLLDTERRMKSFRQFYVGRRVLDFGCGEGNFLRQVYPCASSASGVELQQSFREALSGDGILCHSDISQALTPVDTVFMFHVLEHLSDPLGALREIRETLEPNSGTLVVEVPHARDLLLGEFQCKAFIDFTLWSQHLVLHTRDSLQKILIAAGFTDIHVSGVQRYGLVNHLTWLNDGKPGGHKGPLSVLETADLSLAYQAALAGLDRTDTLVATARVASNL